MNFPPFFGEYAVVNVIFVEAVGGGEGGLMHSRIGARDQVILLLGKAFVERRKCMGEVSTGWG